jgi:hypothetical protein
MKIKTKNSIYELRSGSICKLSGNSLAPLAPNKWIECIFLSYPKEGERFLFVAGDKTITTSAVISIHDDEERFGWVK